jgi:hypothetical protein
VTSSDEVSELLRRIGSEPRFAGSQSEARARAVCAEHLAESGFTVVEEPFEFSEFPGRFGVPVAGLILIDVIALTVHVYWRHGGAGSALAVFVLGLCIVWYTARWLTRQGTVRIRSMLSRSVNLVARRGQPKVWLVAHVDSKSQTIPMLARIGTIVLTAAAVFIMTAALVGAWLATIAGDFDGAEAQVFLFFALLAMLFTLPMIFCLTGNRSHGALDNASGLVSVLLAARELKSRDDVGVIVTSGEELVLAGARAYVAAHPEPVIALNCDTIDDAGRLLCMRRGDNRDASSAIRRASKRLGLRVRVRPMIPGLLADNLAFSDAGWDAITLSRGNIATLARVHTKGDNLERMSGTGIANAARLLVATVEELS